GSRLALDILLDGVAAQHPKYEHTLASIAMRLLDRCDHQLAARLASAFKEDLRAIFQREIAERLSHTSTLKRVGALRTLRALAERGEIWAEKNLVEEWPNNIVEQKHTAFPLP